MEHRAPFWRYAAPNEAIRLIERYVFEGFPGA